VRWNPSGDDSRQRIDDYLEKTGNNKEAESYKKSTYAWNPNTDQDKILRVTKSSIGTYNWCPEQYYIEKFKGVRGEEQPHHVRGKNVHDMVEWFWDNFTLKDDVLALIKEGKEEEAKEVMYNFIPSPPEPYQYGEEFQIRQWVDWQFYRLMHTEGVEWEPVAVEANIQATRFVEVDGEHIPIHMNGFIDSIFSDDMGFALMELKSGKYKAKSKVPSMRKEMAFYKMMLEHSPHQEFLPITNWGWEFPGGDINGGEGAAIYYEDAKKGGKYAMRSVEKSLVKLIRAHMDMDFPSNPWLGKMREGETLETMLENNRLKCSWCDLKEHCSFWSITDEFLDEIMEDV
jgi:CRISPR/Cas system-associated exonuclease Cas4 (RecB family)|tara:strand:- start:7124 stop:8152 length:1029 start_codon:yes stop_codon:yes gene_type:complete